MERCLILINRVFAQLILLMRNNNEKLPNDNGIFQEHKDATNNGSGASTPITPTQESIALKKALEWELSLDKSDLRSHAWYYATIPRQRAEELVEKDGDFIVRDCVSQPGNYVLTCMSKGNILHFVINKVSNLYFNLCLHYTTKSKSFYRTPISMGQQYFVRADGIRVHGSGSSNAVWPFNRLNSLFYEKSIS